MRVLLIQAPMSESVPYVEPFPPLGLGYLASSLEEDGHAVDIWDPGVQGEAEHEWAGLIEAFGGPDVIGISSTTVTYNRALQIARLAKRVVPSAVVVLGGSHATFRSEEALQECAEIDAVVGREGEKTFRHYIVARANRSSEEVPGVTTRVEGRAVRYPDRLPPDVNTLPPPARHLFAGDKYLPAIVSSRGCTHSCTFCSASAMSGTYRARSPEAVVKELRTLDLSYVVTFCDNTFAGSEADAYDLCREIIDQRLDVIWATDLRVDKADEGLLGLMHEAGCRYLDFGVESGNDAILARIGKGITKDLILSAVPRAVEKGFGVTCSFTVGHADDTEESILQTRDLMMTLKTEGATCLAALVTPFPGTRLREHAGRFGVTIEDNDWDHYTMFRPVMSTRHLSREQIGQLFTSVLVETGGFTPVSSLAKREGLRRTSRAPDNRRLS